LRDLTLQLEEYGHMLYVMGSRLIHYDGELCQAKFEKRFRIGTTLTMMPSQLIYRRAFCS